jgi:predicted transposase YbfD/YdcC
MRQVGGRQSVELSYSMSSLAGGSDREAQRLGSALRGRWGIENRGHWVLDVSFHEDGCRPSSPKPAALRRS